MSKEELFQAAFDGHDEKVEQLLVHNPELLNLHEERQFKSVGNGMYFPQGQATALIYAAMAGNAKCLKLLLEKGPDLNAIDEDKKTALIWAAAKGRDNCLMALVHAGAVLDAKDNDGRSALMLAARNGHVSCLSALLSAGADKEARDMNGWSPIMFAADNDKWSCVVALAKAGANDVPDKAGKTVLMKANALGLNDICQELKDAQLAVLAQHEEESEYGFFAMLKATFMELEELLTHEVAMERGLLVLILKDDNGLYYVENGTRIRVDRTQLLFVSQRWFSEGHPDIDAQKYPGKSGMKVEGTKSCLRNPELVDVMLVWFDLYSIPQVNPEHQQQAINSLPFYVRNCYHFVTLTAVTGVVEKLKGKNIDRGSLIVYNSRGWCRLERLAATSPAIDFKNSCRRLAASQLWHYDITTNRLNLAPFAFADAGLINPLGGEFRDGEKDKKRIAQTVLQLCAYIEHFSGIDEVVERSKMIRKSAESYAGYAGGETKSQCCCSCS